MSALLLAACAGRPIQPPVAESVAVVPVQPANPVPGPELIRRLAAIEVGLADYPVPRVRLSWQRELRVIETLAEQGVLEQARVRSRALQREITETTQRYYQQQAYRYLSGAGQFAMLRRAERDQLREMEFAYQREDYRQAYFGSRALYRKLWSSQAWITVRSGDTLAKIAARPEVFDNPNLWPLLQQANKGLVRDSKRLKIGWRLRYPVYPKLDEIFAAVKISTGQ